MSITSNITSGFIDLATFDEIEKYMYGGPDATAYFVREVRKSTWFTQVPVALTNAAGNPGFNQQWSVNISRAGDYLLQTWLRVTIPSVQLAAGTAGTLRWTQNLMHNLVQYCTITFNDLDAAHFNARSLDFWAAFTTPAGKQVGYANMIGNIPTLTTPTPNTSAIAAATLNLPLPFFYSRDSGVSLPTAALPYNEMRINFTFADWTQLLVYNPGPTAGGTPQQDLVPTTAQLLAVPTLSIANVWANYAIVSNDERKRMACGPRDILMEQVYIAPTQSWNPNTNSNPSYDLRFSYAVKVLFFAVQNTTCASYGSNYSTVSPTVTSTGGVYSAVLTGAADPILQTSLIYENTARLFQMGSDYFSLINPWYSAPVIPTDIGYHQYSYSLDYICLDPLGSTNYGKLTNVSIQPQASTAAIAAATVTVGSTSPLVNQTYNFITTIVVNNIIRVSGGALGLKGKARKGRCQRSYSKSSLDKHSNCYQAILA